MLHLAYYTESNQSSLESSQTLCEMICFKRHITSTVRSHTETRPSILSVLPELMNVDGRSNPSCMDKVHKQFGKGSVRMLMVLSPQLLLSPLTKSLAKLFCVRNGIEDRSFHRWQKHDPRTSSTAVSNWDCLCTALSWSAAHSARNELNRATILLICNCLLCKACNCAKDSLTASFAAASASSL